MAGRENSAGSRKWWHHMWRASWPYAFGFLIAISLLGVLLVWEWSCSSDGWAGSYKGCDFWTKQSPYYTPHPN